MNKKMLLAEPHAVIGHTMQSKSALLSAAMMSAIRTAADSNNPGVVVVNDGYVSVVSQDTLSGLTGTVNHLSSIDEIPLIGRESVDWQKLLEANDKLKLAEIEESETVKELIERKKRLSEIVERDRGIEIRKQKTELEYGKFIEDDGYLVRKLRKPNTGIEIGSYKKKPKKQKQRKF